MSNMIKKIISIIPGITIVLLMLGVGIVNVYGAPMQLDPGMGGEGGDTTPQYQYEGGIQTNPRSTQTNPAPIQTNPSSNQTNSGPLQTSPNPIQTNPGPIQTNPKPTQTNVGIPNVIKVDSLYDLLNLILNIVTEIGAIVAVLFILWSGFLFVTAQGNEQKLTKAKNAFFYTLIGTTILLGSSVIAKILLTTVETITDGIQKI